MEQWGWVCEDKKKEWDLWVVERWLLKLGFHSSLSCFQFLWSREWTQQLHSPQSNSRLVPQQGQGLRKESARHSLLRKSTGGGLVAGARRNGEKGVRVGVCAHLPSPSPQRHSRSVRSLPPYQGQSMLDLGTLLLVAGILTWKQVYGGWGADIDYAGKSCSKTIWIRG